MKETKKPQTDLTIFEFYELLLITNEKSCWKRGISNRVNKEKDKMNLDKEKRRKLLKALTEI